MRVREREFGGYYEWEEDGSNDGREWQRQLKSRDGASRERVRI